MRTLRDLLSTFPQTGRVEWIGVRPARREPLVSVDVMRGHGDITARIVEEGSIRVGDHVRERARDTRRRRGSSSAVTMR